MYMNFDIYGMIPQVGTKTVFQGETKNITITITTAGTPGYVYVLAVDGVNKLRYPAVGTTTETSHVFSYTFSEAAGAHTVVGGILDSCVPAKIASDTWTVNIVVCPTPVVTMDIP